MLDFTKENNYGLDTNKNYWTVGCALNEEIIREIDAIAEKENMKRGQLLRSWVLKRLNYEKMQKTIRGW